MAQQRSYAINSDQDMSLIDEESKLDYESSDSGAEEEDLFTQ